MERTMAEKKLYLQYSLSISQFARAVGVNRTYVSRALTYHKLNFLRYVNAYRVQHAVGLMLRNPLAEITTEEIALKSGFLNERRMGYSFRQTYGVTITVFRKRVCSLNQAKNFSTALRASGSANTATRS